VDAPKSKRTKTPLTKAKLDKYRALLLAKRAELFGDVESMENEALRSESGGLSNTPQHLAEQGSESYDQSLSLNLAAQDRKVIREIDEALKRIDEGIYGLCELTNLPIPEERLDEIPWARYTIEAARQLEQRSVGIGGNPGGYGQ
jgi:RNA polymerase-binding transcription factor DksA